MSKLDPRIEAVRDQYGLSESDFWELPQKKGTWIAKHSALEVAAVKADIRFDNPIVIEASTNDGIAVLSVRGQMYERVSDKENRPPREEWATGEASPKNNKNAYPWAMAEKRAKDRVILKLIGMHGLAYSEDEADDFQRPATAAVERLSSYRAKTIINTAAIQEQISTATSAEILKNLRELYEVTCAPWMPNGWVDAITGLIDTREKQLAGYATANETLDRQFSETMREELPPETVRAVKLAHTP